MGLLKVFIIVCILCIIVCLNIVKFYKFNLLLKFINIIKIKLLYFRDDFN